MSQQPPDIVCVKCREVVPFNHHVVDNLGTLHWECWGQIYARELLNQPTSSVKIEDEMRRIAREEIRRAIDMWSGSLAPTVMTISKL